MGKAKFTKGPWQAKDLEVESSGRMIADCGISNYKNSEEEERANAHLIAVAPDMYKMLDEVNRAIIHCDNEIGLADVITCMCHDIDQLLKKARGE